MYFKVAVAKYFPDFESYEEFPDSRFFEFKLEGDEAMNLEALLCLVRLVDAGRTTYRQVARVLNQGGCGQSDCCGSEYTVYETHVTCEDVRFNEWDPPTEKHEISEVDSRGRHVACTL